ncbi:MAG: ribosome maturation factor RimP [Corynebacterium sp.]|nr:ribosome maturation factor RimP [Corynebacterium sp.]
MAFPSEQTLFDVVHPLAAQLGLDVEDIKTTKAGKKSQVIISVDGDKRPSSDDLENLSRTVGAAFDAAEEAGELNFGAGYTLEISTPGVDLPLTHPRHFRRNRGRLVVPHTQGGDKAESFRLGALSDDETRVIAVMQAKGTPQVEVKELANIAPAMVEIEFAEVPATQKEIVGYDFASAAELAAQ